MRESFAASLYADELLDVAPPRRHVLVPDRPVDADSFARVRLVIEITPTKHAAAPHDRLAADLPAANPRERFPFRRRVGVVEIVDEELARVLVARAALALDRLVALEPVAVAHSTVPLLIRHHVLDVVDRWIDRTSRFEHDCLQAVLRQLLGSPATGDPRADNDRVVCICHRQTLGVKGTLPS